MILHIIIATLLWLTAIFQSKIPYNFKASFIVVIFYFIGLAGIYQFGLIAGGVAFFVVAGPVATLLFNGTKGLYILAIGLGSVVILGLLTLSGNIKYSYDIATYAVASSSWITSIFSWVLTSTVLSVALYTFNKNMISALHLSHDNQKALRLSEEKLKIAIQEKEQSLRTLEAAFNEIKTLKGIIPICSYCHNIRDDKGAWDKMESYLSKHSDAEFSHGICPKCLVKARADAGFE
ncbi:MAG: hypothetical protein OEW97_07425 [Gammaproteobacteria bacterium]|nr:hypothetical protein [Gammaproteobacteria bacterium]